MLNENTRTEETDDLNSMDLLVISRIDILLVSG
jgi:hypothetical protein